MECALSYSCYWYGQLSFQWKKQPWCWSKLEVSLIFISGIISIIIQKNTICTNKIRVIHFCPNFVFFLPENVHSFYFLGWLLPPMRPCLRSSFPFSVSVELILHIILSFLGKILFEFDTESLGNPKGPFLSWKTIISRFRKNQLRHIERKDVISDIYFARKLKLYRISVFFSNFIQLLSKITS